MLRLLRELAARTVLIRELTAQTAGIRELPAQTVVFRNRELLVRTAVGGLILASPMGFRILTRHIGFVNINIV